MSRSEQDGGHEDNGNARVMRENAPPMCLESGDQVMEVGAVSEIVNWYAG